MHLPAKHPSVGRHAMTTFPSQSTTFCMSDEQDSSLLAHDVPSLGGSTVTSSGAPASASTLSSRALRAHCDAARSATAAASPKRAPRTRTITTSSPLLVAQRALGVHPQDA